MNVEFGDELLDVVAAAIYAHDIGGHERDWKDVAPPNQRIYVAFAQAALQAMYKHSKVDEQFAVCGAVPIEGHPDYEFSSKSYATLEEAEKCHKHWVDQYKADGATYIIEHSARILLNTLRYWTQEDIDRINAIAKARAEELAKYVG